MMRRRGKVVLYISLFLLLICAIGYLVFIRPWLKENERKSELRQATADVEMALTVAHGREVQTAIEEFVLGAYSLETDLNPDLLPDYYAGPQLEYQMELYKEFDNGNRDSYLVTVAIDVSGLRVLEYSSDRFMVIACQQQYVQEVTPQGEFIRAFESWPGHVLYVFWRQNDRWKVVSTVGIDDLREHYARDWVYFPDWEKRELGDVQAHFYKDCFTDY